MNISLIRAVAAVASLLLTVVLFDRVASLAEPAADVTARLAPASTLALAEPRAGRH